MKRVVIGLLVVLALLLVADRAAARWAASTVAAELQVAAGLAERPHVRIGGFPFLTQAVAGRYAEVELEAIDVPAGEIVLSRLDARVRGLEVPLSQAVSGDVAAAPADRVDARAALSFDDLSRRAGDRRLALAPGPDRTVRVTGSVEVLGRTLSASAVSTVTLEGQDVVVTAQSFDVGAGVVDALLTRVLRDRLDFRFTVAGLPYGLQLTGLTVTPDGVVLTAAGDDVVLAP